MRCNQTRCVVLSKDIVVRGSERVLYPSSFWVGQESDRWTSNVQLGNMAGWGAHFMGEKQNTVLSPMATLNLRLLNSFTLLLGGYSYSRIHFMTDKVSLGWRKLEECYLGGKAIWLGRGSLTPDEWHKVTKTPGPLRKVFVWGSGSCGPQQVMQSFCFPCFDFLLLSRLRKRQEMVIVWCWLSFRTVRTATCSHVEPGKAVVKK